MLSYVIRRVLFTVPVFAIVSLISFALISLFPGDFYTPSMVGAALAGLDPYEFHEALRVMSGIDKPFIVQWWIWITGVVTKGDFGFSFRGSGSVARYIFHPSSGLYWTLIIVGTSMFLAWLFAVPLGILTAVYHNRWIDHLIGTFTYMGISIPGYVLGWIFLWFIFRFINPMVWKSWLWGLCDYAYRGQPLTWAKALNHTYHLLPAWLIVGAPMFAMVVRHLKMSFLDTLRQQYLTTARSKGLRERRILFKHALRNALNPLISLLGLMLPTLLAGSIIATLVLGLPTFGQLFLNAVESQDQHVLTAALLFYSVFLIVGNLIADLLLAVIDPRIRYT
jgi:peptide/nickel transport system permease protein